MVRLVAITLLAFTVALLSQNGAFDTLPAFAASGATMPFPGNYDFQNGPTYVGSGPTNYDFSSGGTGWTKTGTGSATYSGEIATLSGGVALQSSTYSMSTTTQTVKITYKYPAASSAAVAVYVGGTVYGTDNLSCPIGCTSGNFVDKYIA